jgi:hypothetical protein
MTIRTNLRTIKKTYASPERGDIFVMQLPRESYLFGRVVLADVPRERAPMPGAHLIYVYDQEYPTPQPQSAQLRPGRLLIPPVWTNSLAWRKGYFFTVDRWPVGPFDLLRQHCFFKVPIIPSASGKFVDETGAELPQRSEPCGDWGLVSYRWIDDRISDAIGIPRVPE